MAVYVVRGGSEGENKGAGEESALNGEYGIEFAFQQSVRDFSNSTVLRDHLCKIHSVSKETAAQ